MGVIFDTATFYRWLESASDRELLAKRDQLAALLTDLTERDVVAEGKRLLKKIEQELLARKLRP